MAGGFITPKVQLSLHPTPRTKVLAPVDFAGHPADLDVIIKIARQHDLIVVEDAAHALGAFYHGRPVGSLADMTVFSFQPVKHITTGEGGAVVTNNKTYYEKMLAFRSHGIVREGGKLNHWHTLSLPLFPAMEWKDAKRVVAEVRKWFR